MVSSLLMNKTNSIKQNLNDERLFRLSAKFGDADTVKTILDKKNIEYYSPSYNYALRWSAKYGHLNVIKILMNDLVDEQWVLILAILNNHKEMIEYLLTYKNMNINAEHGEALIKTYKHNGVSPMFKYLINNKDVDIFCRDNILLAEIIDRNDLEAIKLLIKSGKLNDYNAKKCLFRTCSFNVEIFKLLLKCGFLPRILGKVDETNLIIGIVNIAMIMNIKDLIKYYNDAVYYL